MTGTKGGKMKILALILAGGRGSRLDILSEHRAKPAVPFAGKYRIIDFALSNCSNSGIYNIGILTQYLPLSMHEHIGVGKPWDFDRREGGVALLQPYTGRKEDEGWYEGTAHAVLQNIEYVKRSDADYVLILSGDHIYKMNYRKLVKQHIKNGGDLTLTGQRVSEEEIQRFGILKVDENNKVREFLEKPKTADSNLGSMGIYVFNKEKLIKILEESKNIEGLDFGKHIIPKIIKENQTYLYEFNDYWKDVGTYDAYWEANLELTKSYKDIKLDMYDNNWKIYTRSEELPAVKFGLKNTIVQSLISNGCIITGDVENSVLGPGVIIEPGAVVKNSVIFNDTIVKSGAYIENSIIDKNVIVGKNTKIGYGNDYTANKEKPDMLYSGLNVIGKGVRIPDEIVISRNCRIYPLVDEDSFVNKVVESGSTLYCNSQEV